MLRDGEPRWIAATQLKTGSSRERQLLQYWALSYQEALHSFRAAAAATRLYGKASYHLEMRAFVCANSNTFAGKSLPCHATDATCHLLLLQFPRRERRKIKTNWQHHQVSGRKKDPDTWFLSTISDYFYPPPRRELLEEQLLLFQCILDGKLDYKEACSSVCKTTINLAKPIMTVWPLLA